MRVGALATKQFGFMLVWCGLLWAVIEACIDPKEGRSVDLHGPFRGDIDKLAPVLRVCRNAILHVSRSGAVDNDARGSQPMGRRARLPDDCGGTKSARQGISDALCPLRFFNGQATAVSIDIRII